MTNSPSPGLLSARELLDARVKAEWILAHRDEVSEHTFAAAEITVSFLAHITALESQAPKLPEDIEGLVGRLEDFARGNWSSGTVNDVCAEASSAIRAMAANAETQDRENNYLRDMVRASDAARDHAMNLIVGVAAALPPEPIEIDGKRYTYCGPDLPHLAKVFREAMDKVRAEAERLSALHDKMGVD